MNKFRVTKDGSTLTKHGETWFAATMTWQVVIKFNLALSQGLVVFE